MTAGKVMKRLILCTGIFVLGALLCFASFSPSVPLQKRATAEDIAAGRTAWEAVKDARGTTTELTMTGEEVAALGVLLREAAGMDHAALSLNQGVLMGEASLPFPVGLWLNTSFAVEGEHEGFPALSFTVGRVTFPAFLTRWGAAFLRQAVKLKGVELAPLDTMVQRVAVAEDSVQATVQLPKSSGLVGQAIAASGEAVNPAEVAEIYCALHPLAATKAPFAEMVNHAFAKAPANGTASYNRSAFVALSFAVVGTKAHSLAADALPLITACLGEEASAKGYNARLAGRADLAKHWAFTAALTAKLGEERAVTLGELKELRDSLKGGSGFSFVDLAANRSGLRSAKLALAPETALSAARQLAAASDEDLLPQRVKEGPEGLSAADFVDQFGALDEARYEEAASAIDRSLRFPQR